MLGPVVDPTRRAKAGILHPARARQRIDLRQFPPPAPLVGVVDYLWAVTWHAPAPHVQEVIPRPAVQVVAERVDGVPRLLVDGVMRRPFGRRLVGDDRAVAVAFRPAGFRPFVDVRVSSLTDRVVPAADVLGDDAGLALHLLDPAVPVEAAASALGAWLAERAPAPDPVAAELGELVERAERDPSLTRAEQLAALAGVTLRTLQRRFGEYVGVGPKWVVQRCRLLDVAAAAHDDAPVDWAALAADLGYTDQSHLIRAFTALVGHPPATYRASSAT